MSTKEQIRGKIRVKTRSLVEQMMESWKTFLTFEPVEKTLWYDHSNETSSAVLSHATIYLVCGSNNWVGGRNLVVRPSNETFSTVLSHDTICLVCSSNFWVCGRTLMVLPFKWTSSAVLSHATSYLVCSSDNWVRGRVTIVWPDSGETSSAVILHGKPCVSLTLATFASERFKDREKPD